MDLYSARANIREIVIGQEALGFFKDYVGLRTFDQISGSYGYVLFIKCVCH